MRDDPPYSLEELLRRTRQPQDVTVVDPNPDAVAPGMGMVTTLASMLPGVGEGMSLLDAMRAAQAGDGAGVALGLAGAIPVAGSLGRGAKAAGEAAQAAARYVKPRGKAWRDIMFDLTDDEIGRLTPSQIRAVRMDVPFDMDGYQLEKKLFAAQRAHEDAGTWLSPSAKARNAQRSAERAANRGDRGSWHDEARSHGPRR